MGGCIEKGREDDDRGGRGPLVAWTRPDSYWDVAVLHLPLALITGIALILPHLVACDDLPLIPCTFLKLTGYPCPFCGLTRSFWAMAHGSWGAAATRAPLACLIYGATALLFAWHTAGLLTGLRIRSGFFRFSGSRLVIWLMVVTVLLNWAYRLSLGLS